jgi:hypothetical protein
MNIQEWAETEKKRLAEGRRVQVPHKVALTTKCGCGVGSPERIHNGWNAGQGNWRWEDPEFEVQIRQDDGLLVHVACNRPV